MTEKKQAGQLESEYCLLCVATYQLITVVCLQTELMTQGELMRKCNRYTF